MNEVITKLSHRILVIDDNPNIHKDFQTILMEDNEDEALDSLKAEVFGDAKESTTDKSIFELDFASQGEEGCEKIRQACSENRPYELAFVDMRMPPGWDGLKTIEHIWQIDPKVQIVICTAYSDYSWGDITERLGKSENLLILKKPFDSAEVAQLAVALTEKWNLAKKASMKMEELEHMVKEQTDELKETNNKLKMEIAEREQAELKLAELVRTVENTNKELRDFASIISHDLKAPLRGIKNLATWILEDCRDKFDEKNNDQMNQLLSRVERMHRLIEGVLHYSRIGRVEEQSSTVDLKKFIPEIIDMVGPPDNINVSIENELPPILCKETHIMQLFQNLLGNAIRYMDKEQGQIKIGCIEEGNFWQFSIADNGPGISEKDFEKVFKMFQILPVKKEFEGTGVGLTVAKKIVELYGGRIWIESTVGQGSTFFFTLPKYKTEVTDEKLQANIIG